jgi:hypothetical protein
MLHSLQTPPNNSETYFFKNCLPTVYYTELKDQSLSISFVLQFSGIAESCVIFARDMVGIPVGASISVIFFGRSGILHWNMPQLLVHYTVKRWFLIFCEINQLFNSYTRAVIVCPFSATFNNFASSGTLYFVRIFREAMTDFLNNLDRLVIVMEK